MTSLLKRYALVITIVAMPLTGAMAQPVFTDISVFAANSTGLYTSGFAADSRPGNSENVWIQTLGGSFLNGPADVNAQPSISLSLGVNSFKLLMDPGSDQSHYGINLFFGGSLTPSISAVAPRLTSISDPHSFSANGAADTIGAGSDPHVAGAGTLSFVIGDRLVTLTDYYFAQQNVFNLDLVGTSTTGSDGLIDYVGGITLTVTEVPEPQMALWAMGLLMAGAAGYRKARLARKN